MMKYILSISMMLLFMGCYISDPNDDFLEGETFRFEEMKIEYIIVGGWIATRSLDITGVDGMAYAYIFHDEPIMGGSRILDRDQGAELASMFRFFRNYERHYAPDKHYTDQNLQTVILHYEGQSDTVSVYFMAQADVPRSFGQLVNYLDDLQNEILEMYGATYSQFPIFYRNSFESPDDISGWYGYGSMDIVEHAPYLDGRYSLRVSGGYPIPHAKFDFEPASHDRQFILQGWGKAIEGTGGVGLFSGFYSMDESIGFTVSRNQWTFYESEETLFVAAGDTMSIHISAGGIVPATIGVHLITIREIE